MSLELKKDENGDIVTMPVMGWVTGTVAEIAVLLAIEYSETSQEIDTDRKLVQFGLTPQQSLQLAEKLTTLAKRVLEPQRGKSPN